MRRKVLQKCDAFRFIRLSIRVVIFPRELTARHRVPNPRQKLSVEQDPQPPKTRVIKHQVPDNVGPQLAPVTRASEVFSSILPEMVCSAVRSALTFSPNFTPGVGPRGSDPGKGLKFMGLLWVGGLFEC